MSYCSAWAKGNNVVQENNRLCRFEPIRQRDDYFTTWLVSTMYNSVYQHFLILIFKFEVSFENIQRDSRQETEESKSITPRINRFFERGKFHVFGFFTSFRKNQASLFWSCVLKQANKTIGQDNLNHPITSTKVIYSKRRCNMALNESVECCVYIPL